VIGTAGRRLSAAGSVGDDDEIVVLPEPGRVLDHKLPVVSGDLLGGVEPLIPLRDELPDSSTDVNGGLLDLADGREVLRVKAVGRPTGAQQTPENPPRP
jgi:hypothetical protein